MIANTLILALRAVVDTRQFLLGNDKDPIIFDLSKYDWGPSAEQMPKEMSALLFLEGVGLALKTLQAYYADKGVSEAIKKILLPSFSTLDQNSQLVSYPTIETALRNLQKEGKYFIPIATSMDAPLEARPEFLIATTTTRKDIDI